jgi:hypothetical protein
VLSPGWAQPGDSTKRHRHTASGLRAERVVMRMRHGTRDPLNLTRETGVPFSVRKTTE